MRRKVILFLSLADRLINLIDEETELFFQERQFLINKSFKTEIIELPAQRKDIELKKTAIIKEINKLLWNSN